MRQNVSDRPRGSDVRHPLLLIAGPPIELRSPPDPTPRIPIWRLHNEQILADRATFRACIDYIAVPVYCPYIKALLVRGIHFEGRY